MAVTSGFASLPNEILITILSSFPTRDLLPLASTSERIHDIIIRIIHTRLIKAAALKDHKLVLECYHPSNKLTTPYLFCDYLGTDGLSSDTEGIGELYKDVEKSGRLGRLAGLYSHFRPLQPEGERKTWRPRPAGGFFQAPLDTLDGAEDYVSSTVDLESHELFSQLCTVTNIVKIGSRQGLFLTCINIGEGLTRIFRDWLAKRCESAGSSETQEDYEERLLWADAQQHVGLRFRVQEKEGVHRPLLLASDEDAPVSYVVQYEELVIRTTQLLLKVEESMDHEIAHSGNAVVLASWDAQ